MHKWRTQFKLENRLIYRNWFLIAAPIVFFLTMYFAISLREFQVPVNATNTFLNTFYGYQPLFHTMTLGIVMFLGVLSIRHHYNRRAYELYGAWPVNQTVVIPCKFAAVFLYFSIYTVFMAIVFWLRAIQYGLSSRVIINHLIHNVFQYEWSYGVTLALAMFLAVVIPGRIAYLIAFCGWMFGTYFMDIFLITHFEWFALKTFHLSQYFASSLSTMTDTVWTGLNQYENGLSRLFVFFFTLLLLFVMIEMLKIRRPTRTLKRWNVIGLMALFIAGASAWPYFSLWSDRYHTHAAQKADSIQYAADHPHSSEAEEVKRKGESLPDSGTYRFPVTSYDIKAKQTGRHHLSVTTKMNVPYKAVEQHQPLAFTLNRGFTVNSLKVNGKPAKYERKKNEVQISDLPTEKSKSLSLIFQYDGAVDEWAAAYGNELGYAFTRGRNLFLPSYAAWYPLPGKQPLYYSFNIMAGPKTRINQENGLTNDGADFSVSLKDFSNQVYTTIQEKDRSSHIQVFAENSAKGVSLVSGNLYAATVPGTQVALIGSCDYKKQLNHFSGLFADYISYYKDWLGLPEKTRNMFYLQTEYIRSESSAIPLDSSHIANTDAFESLYTDKNGKIDDHQMLMSFEAALFNQPNDVKGIDQINFTEGLVPTVRKVIGHMYSVEKQHEKLDAGVLEGDKKSTEVVNMIKKAIQEGKLPQVKKILKHFYQHGLSFDGDKPKNPITLEDWKKEWNHIMGSGEGK